MLKGSFKKNADKRVDVIHSVAPAVVISFLREIMPFKTLAENELFELANHCRVDFFPQGARLLTADESEITHIYIIQRGGIKAFLIDDKGDEVLKDYRGQGSYVGALGIIRGTLANLNIETVEDTFCFLIPREVFLNLLKNKPTFSHYFLKTFSDQVVSTAYQELRHQKISRRASEDLYLFNMTAGQVAKQARKMSIGCTVQEVARLMAHLRIGSMLLHHPDDPNDIVGIITDTDFRIKVIAKGLDYNKPVSMIMSTPVQSVTAETLCFDVLIKMMSTGIRHLAVLRDGKINSVLTSHDIMVLQGNSPFYLFKEIIKQRDIQGLSHLTSKIREVIRNLIREGAKAGNIARITSILNDQLLVKLLSLLEGELGKAPLSYCWLLMGSEGRREQSFTTWMDNGIVYADPYTPEQKDEAQAYFAELGKRATEHLRSCGYPLSDGEAWESEMIWCQPFSVWLGYFTRWFREPDPADVHQVGAFCDLRAGYGDERLAASLRNHVTDLVRQGEMLTYHMARYNLSIRVPLSFFNNFIVERNGEHKNRLDIRLRGIEPIVSFARILCLKYGMKETNTIARLQALQGEGVVSMELASAAIRAYEIQQQFRIVHQLDQIEREIPPDNFIAPVAMTEMERAMLKEAFGVIEKLQAILDRHFPLIAKL